MSVPDREQVRDLVDLADHWTASMVRGESYRIVMGLKEAARAWLDQGDALVIRKDENGYLPDWTQGALGKALIDYADGWNRIDFHISNLLAALSDRSDTPLPDAAPWGFDDDGERGDTQ